MNKKFIAVGSLGLLLGGLTLTSGKVFAYRGDASVQGPNCTPERHEQMTSAFESNDYNSWKELMEGKGRVSEVVNEGNFSRFAEAHRLSQEGNSEEALKIRQELGLGLRNGTGRGEGGGLSKNSNR